MISEDIISDSLLQTSCETETACSKVALFSCHHCSKRLCLEHINEHNDLNIIRVEELSNDIDSLTHLLSNLGTEKSFENARTKLNIWKKENLDNIEKIYELNSNEIDRLEIELNSRLNIFKETSESTISDLRTQLSYLKKIAEISQQQLSPIESDLNQLRQCLQSVQCEISIETKNISFNNLINIHNVFIDNRQLLNNTKMQSYRILSVENMKEFISSQKNETILWLDTQKQLHYVDEYFQTHLLTLPEMASSVILSNQPNRKTDINIVDMKWCSFAEVFLILFQRYLFSFNPKTRKFTHISLTRYKNYPFRCLSCFNNTSIYISYCTSGIEIELWKYSYNNNNDISMNECYKHWNCLTNDKNEWISNMNANSGLHIGLLIRIGSAISTRFELRDENLNFLKKIQLDNDYIDGVFPFRDHYWFIKSLSEKYYIYSTEINKYYLSSFHFPFGFQEFGINAVVIGNNQRELIYCDI